MFYKVSIIIILIRRIVVCSIVISKKWKLVLKPVNKIGFSWIKDLEKGVFIKFMSHLDYRIVCLHEFIYINLNMNFSLFSYTIWNIGKLNMFY